MNRRRFLQSTAAVTALPCSLPAAAASPALRVIDTHTHFYDPTRPEGVPWPKAGTPLYRTVLPADWLAQAGPLGIRETVVVEASPWVEDNQWILDLAEREKCIVGLVGNLNPTDPDFSKHLDRFSAKPLFRGLRWRGDLVKMDEKPAEVLAAARLMADKDLSLDLNGPPAVLSQAVKLAAQVPSLRMVINHLGSSGDPNHLKPGWREVILELAQQPNVFMKVSALVEQAKAEQGKAPADVAYYLPILDPLWQAFGPDRLIYGSDWPVSDRGAPYETVFNLVSSYFRGKGPEAAEKFFSANSRKAYRWVDRAG